MCRKLCPIPRRHQQKCMEHTPPQAWPVHRSVNPAVEEPRSPSQNYGERQQQRPRGILPLQRAARTARGRAVWSNHAEHGGMTCHNDIQCALGDRSSHGERWRPVEAALRSLRKQEIAADQAGKPDVPPSEPRHAPKPYPGRFLVRLSELVRAPRGLPGPGFGLPWPAGGQVGWPSRWGHFSGPGGRTAARVPFPRVRFRPLCRGVAKSGPHDPGGFPRRFVRRSTGPGRPRPMEEKNGREPIYV